MFEGPGASARNRSSAGASDAMPKIGFLVERRYLRQNMPGAVKRVLAARSIPSDIICPQNGSFDPQTGVFQGADGQHIAINDYDVLVARIRTPLGLAMLRYADVAGIRAINGHSPTQRVRNKAKMALVLARESIPCAPTVLADDIAVLASLDRSWFPLILKPTYGDNSQGLRLIRRPEELPDVRWSDGLVLAQRYLPNDGFDTKLYVCGSRVWSVRKPSPLNTDAGAVCEPVRADAASIELARRCGAAFGLEIYGVDTVQTANGPVVIEVNEFPNFSAVHDAADTIADYILKRVEQGRSSDAYRRSTAAVAR